MLFFFSSTIYNEFICVFYKTEHLKRISASLGILIYFLLLLQQPLPVHHHMKLWKQITMKIPVLALGKSFSQNHQLRQKPIIKY